MKQTWNRLFLAVGVAALAFTGLLTAPGLAQMGAAGAMVQPDAPLAQAEGPYTIFLPTAQMNYPNQTHFGIEMSTITREAGLNEVYAANTSWIRRNGLLWSTVEPQPGERRWSDVALLEGELQNAYSRGMKVILTVRSTPAWAQKLPGYTCGPMKPEAIAAFAAFMRDVVARYSVPPYNVHYYEIWNEPDADPLQYGMAQESPFGCWGNVNDPDYGGGYYGEVLKAVYPQMKAANPKAQLVAGALLMDCNPTAKPGCSGEPASRFLEGFLKTSEGAFDGISFHAYDYYAGELGKYYNPNWGNSQSTMGPVVIAKTQFVLQKLAKYNLTGKFLMNTESAILQSAACDATCQETKAHYATQVYAAAAVLNLRANIWYSLLGWRNSELLRPDLTPQPAYRAFAFARTQMGNALSAQDITSYTGARVVQIERRDATVWVLWSVNGNSVPVNLPKMPTAVWNWDSLAGDYKPATVSQAVSVGFAPVYVEWKK